VPVHASQLYDSRCRKRVVQASYNQAAEEMMAAAQELQRAREEEARAWTTFLTAAQLHETATGISDALHTAYSEHRKCREWHQMTARDAAGREEEILGSLKRAQRETRAREQDEQVLCSFVKTLHTAWKEAEKVLGEIMVEGCTHANSLVRLPLHRTTDPDSPQPTPGDHRPERTTPPPTDRRNSPTLPSLPTGTTDHCPAFYTDTPPYVGPQYRGPIAATVQLAGSDPPPLHHTLPRHTLWTYTGIPGPSTHPHDSWAVIALPTGGIFTVPRSHLRAWPTEIRSRRLRVQELAPHTSIDLDTADWNIADATTYDHLLAIVLAAGNADENTGMDADWVQAGIQEWGPMFQLTASLGPHSTAYMLFLGMVYATPHARAIPSADLHNLRAQPAEVSAAGTPPEEHMECDATQATAEAPTPIPQEGMETQTQEAEDREATTLGPVRVDLPSREAGADQSVRVTLTAIASS